MMRSKIYLNDWISKDYFKSKKLTENKGKSAKDLCLERSTLWDVNNSEVWRK